MNTALDRFVNELMKEFYPERDIPHFIALDIFIPWIRQQLKYQIRQDFEYGEKTVTLTHDLLIPFMSQRMNSCLSTDNEMPEVAIPEDCLEYLENIIALEEKRKRGTDSESTGCLSQ